MTNSLEIVIDEELIKSSWKKAVFVIWMDKHVRVLQNVEKTFHVFVTPAIILSNEKIFYKWKMQKTCRVNVQNMK